MCAASAADWAHVELYLALVELYFNKMLADSLKKKSLREQYVELLL